MKTFNQLIVESRSKELHHVLFLSNMNIPSLDYQKTLDKVQGIANRYQCEHSILVANIQDSKQNPLSANKKIMHLERFFPELNFFAMQNNTNGLLEHLSELYSNKITHLHFIKNEEVDSNILDLIAKFNGKEDSHGYFNFSDITEHKIVNSIFHKNERTCTSFMLENARKNQIKEFSSYLPEHISSQQAYELLMDIREGMGYNGNYARGTNKAIFVTGGPGSGKDIVIRECIAESKCVEFNFVQAIDCLTKKKIDFRTEAVRNHLPLIINGPADDFEKVNFIKENLENNGYKTILVFVDTTDETSKERNTSLSKMMIESIRHEKWEKAHKNNELYSQMFENYIHFDNNQSLENNSNVITETYVRISEFLDSNILTEINKENRFLKRFDEHKTSKYIQQTNIKTKKMLRDNNSPIMQYQAKLGKQDDVRDGDNKINSNYIFRTYSENSKPVLLRGQTDRISNFQKDANTERIKKYGNKALQNSKVGEMDGIGGTFNTRGSTGAASATMGDITYREEVSRGGTTDYNNDDVINYAGQTKGPQPNPLREKKKLKGFKEAIDSPSFTEMGVGGTLGGSSNKEPLETPMDKFGMSGKTIKIKKTGAK